MDVFALTATLSLQADNFFSTLESAAQAVVDFASDSLQTSMAFDKSMSHVQAISGKVAGTVEEQSKYMSKLISSAEEMGLQYEKTADSTETAMNIINAKAAALGHDTMFTAAEVADAFGYMAMAGWDYQEMLNGIDAVVSLSAASGEDLARTSDIVTDAITAFGLEAKDASRFSDILAVTSAKSNTNVGMMGETFKYVANEAGSFRYEIEDIAEAIGLMANTGVKASMAGTALANIMRRINDNTGATDKKPGVRDFLESQGVQIFDQDYNNKEWQAYKKVLAENTQKMATATKEERERLQNQIDYYYEAAYNTGTYRDFNNIIDDARKWWGTLGDVEKAEYGKMIAGAYGSKGWKALMNATEEDIENVRNGILNSEGASQDMMNIMTDNLWGDIKKYESAFDAVKRTIGEELTPMARAFTKYGTESWDTLLNAYGEGGLDLLPEAIHDVLQKGSELIDKYLPEWKENGAKLMSTMSAGIREAAPILGEVIGTFGPMIGDFLSQNSEIIITTVSDFIASISPGIISAIAGIFDGIGRAWPEIKKSIGTQLEKYGVYDWISKNLNIFGLGDTISSALSSLFSAPESGTKENPGNSFFGKNGWLKTGIGVVDDFLGTTEKRLNELGNELFGPWEKPLEKLEPVYPSEALTEYINTVNEAYDAVYRLEGVANAEILTESYHNDMTTEYANAAYNAVMELVKEKGEEILTKSVHVNDTSVTVQEALDSFLSLYQYDKFGVRTFSEHRDDASSIISTFLAVLAALKEEDGYTSHTSSVHDVITNYITNGTPSSSTDTVKGTKAGTGSTASLRVHGPTFDESLIHSRSMFDGTILRGATMFGWDAQGRPQIGGGEGAEAVVGVNSLDRMIERSVQNGLSGLISGIADAVKGDDRPMYVVLDTGALVGGIGKEMDAELGRLGNWRSGGAA